MLSTLIEASQLLAALDSQLLAIVALSCRVSVTAVLLGAGFGMPLGAWLATAQFRGRTMATVLLNACMGLPSVLIGVLVYLLLSRSGPLGSFGLLYSPLAMIIAQTILVVPLVAALSRQTIADVWRHDGRELRSLGLSRWQVTATLLYHCRHGLITVVLAALGRALSEVGAVMIVGGNIEGFTRVMTTSIALETAKGDLPKSVALGMVLLAIVCTLNALVEASRSWATRRSGH